MTTYGVTSTGFVKKTYDVIKEEVQDDLRDEINSKLNLLDTSVLGQIVGIFSDKVREVWDVMEAVYRSAYPDSASAEALDNVGALTGATRIAEAESTVTLDQMFLDNGVTVPVGSIVRIGSNGTRWVTTAEVTNSTGYAATLSTTAEAEDTGALPGYASEIDTIVTPISGWSAAAALTNTVDQNYTLDGTTLEINVDRSVLSQSINFSGGDPWSASDVAAKIDADVAGATSYAVGTKVRIASEREGEGSSIQIIGGTANAVLLFSTTEVKGFNTEDAALGNDVELDPAFRLRREQLLRVAGTATVEAIRSAILEISGILQCLVIENTGNVIDTNGLPAKSFEAIVQRSGWTAAQEQEVAEAIWDNKPAGIEPYGSESDTVEDSMGFDHEIGWSKPTDVPIYMELTLTTNDDYPSDGDDQVKEALVAYGATLQINEDVIALQFKSVPLDVAGVEDVTVFKIDTVTPPVASINISIGVRSIATFATTRITIT